MSETINIPSTQEPGKPPAQEEELITFKEVLTRLGVSKPTLYSRIHVGYFHPVRDPKDRRRLLFHPGEVDQEEKRCLEAHRTKLSRGRVASIKTPKIVVPPPPPPKLDTKQKKEIYEEQFLGERSSLAFSMFTEGKGVRDCVIELKMSHGLASTLYNEWKSSGSEWHVPHQQLSYLRGRFSWDENPPTPLGLLAAIHKYIEKAVTSAIPTSADPETPKDPAKEADERKKYYEKLNFATGEISFD